MAHDSRQAMSGQFLQELFYRIYVLEGTVQQLEEKVEEQAKQNCLKLFGLHEPRKETDNVCLSRVLEVLNFHSGSDTWKWCKEDIEKAYRVGQRSGRQPRPIVIKFYRTVDKVWLLRDKQTRDSLRSDGLKLASALTRYQAARLRTARAEGKRAYFSNGRLHVLDRPAADRSDQSRDHRSDRDNHKVRHEDFGRGWHQERNQWRGSGQDWGGDYDYNHPPSWTPDYGSHWPGGDHDGYWHYMLASDQWPALHRDTATAQPSALEATQALRATRSTQEVSPNCEGVNGAGQSSAGCAVSLKSANHVRDRSSGLQSQRHHTTSAAYAGAGDVGVHVTPAIVPKPQSYHAASVNPVGTGGEGVPVAPGEMVDLQLHHAASADIVDAGGVGEQVMSDRVPESQHPHTTDASSADSGGVGELVPSDAGSVSGPDSAQVLEHHHPAGVNAVDTGDGGVPLTPDRVPESQRSRTTSVGSSNAGGVSVSVTLDCTPESQRSLTTSFGVSDAGVVGTPMTSDCVPQSQHPHTTSVSPSGAGGERVLVTSEYFSVPELQRPHATSDDNVDAGGVGMLTTTPTGSQRPPNGSGELVTAEGGATCDRDDSCESERETAPVIVAQPAPQTPYGASLALTRKRLMPENRKSHLASEAVQGPTDPVPQAVKQAKITDFTASDTTRQRPCNNERTSDRDTPKQRPATRSQSRVPPPIPPQDRPPVPGDTSIRRRSPTGEKHKD